MNAMAAVNENLRTVHIAIHSNKWATILGQLHKPASVVHAEVLLAESLRAL